MIKAKFSLKENPSAKIRLPANKKLLIFRIKVFPKTKNDIFAPDFPNLGMSREKFEKRLAVHRATVGTILATLVMVGTNFLIDAPLTRFLTGKFSKFITKNQQPQAQEVKK